MFLTSLRLRAFEAGVQALLPSADELVVKFDRLPPMNFETVARSAGVTLKRGSNQLRFARGPGTAWMERLYALVSALPRADGELGGGELPEVMATALTSA